jgi:flagellar biosynthesis protein
MTRRSRRSAAALVYDAPGGDTAPRVVAKGYGLVAEMIVQRAKDAGLYVHEAPEMVSLLMQVDLDDRIPPPLYRAVAELLAWLYQIERGEPVDEAPGATNAAAAEPGDGTPVAASPSPSAGGTESSPPLLPP